MTVPREETPGADVAARADAEASRSARAAAGRTDVAPSGPRPGWGERAGWTLAVAGPLAFLTVFFAWPVVTLVGRGLAPDGALDLSGFGEVLARERTWRILTQTLTQATLGTAVCVALGMPGALVLYRRSFPGRDLLRGVVTVPFVLPSVVVGVAFHALVTRGGPLEALGLDGTLTAVVAALAFFNYGLVVRTVGTMWSRLDPRAVEAARALGASPMRAFATVTLPALAPAIASAASLTFLFCATAYGVVLVLGGVGIGTIETEIYRLTTQYLDLRGAAVLSVVQLGVIALALWVAERARAATQTRLRLRTEAPTSRLRAADAPALAVTAVTVVGLLVAPMAVLVMRSLQRDGAWTLANYTDLGTTGGRSALLVTVWEAAANSVSVAVAAAAIALTLGVAVCLVVSRRPRSRALARVITGLDAAFMLPLGVSAVTVGFGFLITLARPPLALTRSWWILPLAQAVVAVPLVVRTLLPALRAIDPRQREAAAALGAGPGRVLLTVDGPQLLRAGGLAAGFALATSLGEFGATSFLARPQEPTLPVVVYRLIGSPGSQNQGMALAGGVVLAVGSAVVMLGCEWLQTRLGPGRGGSAGTGGQAAGEDNETVRSRGPRTNGGERP
ncbi:ABC transporter permease [Actinomyces naeslundii]|uniref:ABC transporter permease n=1 Tax=Actinomyces naeslundii TaxID=1655 RepID=UPI00094DBFF9|nr:iron ABC transporter permease [Actinomyces naeslundii]